MRIEPDSDEAWCWRRGLIIGNGWVVGLLGAAGYASGSSGPGATAVGVALAAALLNATTGLCAGCRLYRLAARRR